MSRIGKKPIILPEGVAASLKDNEILVSGAKGNLTFKLLPGVKVNITDGKVCVLCQKDDKKTRAIFGLVRSLIANMVSGVAAGFEKELEIIGTGYRAQVLGNKLILSLGFAKPVEIVASGDITFEIKDNKIIVSGIDKTLVGQVAANIRALRPPEAYKGKGIRYVGEVIRKKAGKAGRVGTGAQGAK